MFDFDKVEEEVEAAVEVKAEALRLQHWIGKGKVHAAELVHKAITEQIEEAEMTMSLLESQTKEHRYALAVMEELHSIRNSLPSSFDIGAPMNSSWTVQNPNVHAIQRPSIHMGNGMQGTTRC